MTSTWAKSARRSRRIASATMPVPVSSATKSATASAAAARKQSAATAALKSRLTLTGRKSATSRTTTAPPSVTSTGESAYQSIVGALKPSIWRSVPRGVIGD